MSTTTQILFNSPALHSLKYEQLQKLCKIHAIKASGKKGELITKLKAHAATLPKDAPLSIAARSEDEADEQQDTGEEFGFRESDQWEAMERIDEVDEPASAQGSLSSQKDRNRDYGTANSKSSSKSLFSKALTNSFGFPKATSTPKPDPADELSKISKPYSALPPSSKENMPQADHFILSSHDSPPPLPGHASRPGVQAEPDARLSLSAVPSTPHKQAAPGGTTTIRLVSNPTAQPRESFSTPQLRPFTTAFDLDMGDLASPSRGGFKSPGPSESLYPKLPPKNSAQEPASPSSSKAKPTAEEDMDVDMPGGFDFASPRLTKPLPSRASLAPPSQGADPTTPSPFVFGASDATQPAPRFSFNSPAPPGVASAKLSVLDEMNARLASQGVQGVDSDIFDRPKGAIPAPVVAPKGFATSQRFDKTHQEESAKMESIQDWANRRAGKKRKSTAVDEGNSRVADKKTRVSIQAAQTPSAEKDEEDRRKSKRVRLSTNPAENAQADEEEEEEARKLKEREATRRVLQRNKEKRRSSMGRKSIAPPTPKPKSRFGFFSTAKSLVQNVWGRGAAKVAAPPKPTEPKTLPKVNHSSMGPPPSRPSTLTTAKRVRQSSTSSAGSGTGGTAGSRASTNNTSLNTRTSIAASHSRASRSPLPASTTGTGTLKSTRDRVSSMGARNVAAASNSMGSRMSSLGSKTSTSNADAESSAAAINPGSMMKKVAARGSSTTSRLLAPTASSLAKQQGGPQGSIARKGHGSEVNVFSSPSKPGASAAAAKSPLRRMNPSPAKSSIGLDLDPDSFPKVPQNDPSANPTGSVLRAPSGKRPRISRSKVIARLAEKREAGSSSGTPSTRKLVAKPGRLSGTGKVRSSLGVSAAEKGRVGMGMRNSDVSAGMRMTAKKKVVGERRKSAIGRRATAGGETSAPREDTDMSVDS